MDRGDILTLIDRNVERNRELMKAEILVKEIDFYDHATIDETYESLKDISVIMAADSKFLSLLLCTSSDLFKFYLFKYVNKSLYWLLDHKVEPTHYLKYLL